MSARAASRSAVVVQRAICARPLSRWNVDRVVLSYKILTPTHPAIRRGLPRLPRETTTVQQDDRDMPPCAFRNLVLDIHLIDLDVVRIGEQEATRCPGRRIGVFRYTADERAIEVFAIPHMRIG